MTPEHFRDDAWTAAVIGLGYVGLPLAVSAQEAGLRVIGFDIDSDKLGRLARGDTAIDDVGEHRLTAALEAGLSLTSDEDELRLADAIFIAVPSPLGRNRQPDLRYIEQAAETVRRAARPGQLISLESTTYPGTTDEILVPAATEGRTLDEDVYVCFSPERVDPGNAISTTQIPKVVGGVTPRSGEVAAAAYGRFIDSVHVVSTARAAELTKLLENTYRSVNIALVNELTQVAEIFDVDIWEVVDAAATKPFGFQAFYPGPGVGGHCIPLDPQYLAWKARELRAPTRFVDLAEDVNRGMPLYVLKRASTLLNDLGSALRGSRILGIGVSYKRNIADARESPALDVIELLSSQGAQIDVIDDHQSEEDLKRLGLHRGDLTTSYDLGVVLTDHDGIDYDAVAGACTRVLDTRGVYWRRGGVPGNVTSL